MVGLFLTVYHSCRTLGSPTVEVGKAHFLPKDFDGASHQKGNYKTYEMYISRMRATANCGYIPGVSDTGKTESIEN